MFDFHSHFLPKLDDGSKSTTESIEMLRTSYGQNVEAIVATPHFYPEEISVEKFLENRSKSADRLVTAIGDSHGFPNIFLGAEVAFYEGVNQIDDLESLCMGKSQFILIEMPMTVWSDHLLGSLYSLIGQRNLIPIIAHIDRYFQYKGSVKVVDKFIEMGCLIQMNGSFINEWGSRRIGMKLLKEDKVHLLGSDCHNMTSRPPGLQAAGNAIEKKLGTNKLKNINDRSILVLEKCQRLL